MLYAVDVIGQVLVGQTVITVVGLVGLRAIPRAEHLELKLGQKLRKSAMRIVMTFRKAVRVTELYLSIAN